MNERLWELADQCEGRTICECGEVGFNFERFAELIMQDMHKKVIASILITDVVMEEKGQVPTSEDYISAINNDFGVK